MSESKILVEFGNTRLSGRMNASCAATSGQRKPLVIAIHGGTYTSAYFDVPGYSLLERGDRLGVAVMALDRPGYGQSTPLAPAEATITRNAEVLNEAIGKIWDQQKNAFSGIVLIGHSIGGATVIAMAANKPSWPLLGISVSGVGLLTNPGDAERWASFPEGLVDLPVPIKDMVMFGAEGSFASDMPQASHIANTTCPRAELIDITSVWATIVGGLAAKVTVPVHYRQADTDRLWIVSEEQVQNFSAAFTHAPSVDARLFLNSGHCIDFHSGSEEFQRGQLKFAAAC